jgi:hypothetical protein
VSGSVRWRHGLTVDARLARLRGELSLQQQQQREQEQEQEQQQQEEQEEEKEEEKDAVDRGWRERK